MNSSKPSSNHIIYLDFLRIAAIIAVVFLHLATQNFRATNIGSPEWNVFNIYDSLARWGVPIFVMISGALFLGKEQPIKKLYRKNIFKIIVVLIIWTFLYGLWQLIISNYTSNLEEFFLNLMSNSSYLWFLYMLIGLYIVVPLLKKIVENEKTTKYFLILSFIFAFLIPELIAVIALKSEFVASLLKNKVNTLQIFMVLGFSGYFVLGHYLNKCSIKKRTEIIVYIAGLLSIIFTIIATALTSNSKHELITLFYDNITINVAATSMAIFIFFKNHFPKNLSLKKNKYLQLFSRCSLGVYLTHVFIMDALNVFLNLNSLSFNPIFSIPILSLIILTISYLISIALYKIPFIGKWIV